MNFYSRGTASNNAILLIINYILLELLCAGALLFYSHTRKQYAYNPASKLKLTDKQRDTIKKFSQSRFGYIRFDRKLGWSISENSVSNDGLYKSNSDGVRADKIYSLSIPNGKRRITTFGDSFTHGDQVHNHETWQSIMESKIKSLEVINFGVGGYGLDQTYLRFLDDGIKYDSDIVLIGYMTENIYRNRNRFRPFYTKNTGIPFSKPMFKLVNGRLTLIPSYFSRPSDYKDIFTNKDITLQRLGEDDFYYEEQKHNPYLDWSPAIKLTKSILTRTANRDPYVDDPETFETTKALFKEFRKKVINLGQKPIIAIFPNESDIIDCNLAKDKRYKPLIDYFRSSNFNFIDLGDRLCDYKPKEIFDGHYTPLGNKIVAEALLTYISRHHLHPPNKISKRASL